MKIFSVASVARNLLYASVICAATYCSYRYCNYQIQMRLAPEAESHQLPVDADAPPAAKPMAINDCAKMDESMLSVAKKGTINKYPHKVPPLIVKKDPLYWNWAALDETKIYFPQDFLWGAVTSAHQIEGNCINDWTLWEKEKPITQTGKACDSWNRYPEDIALLKKMHANAYRFSIEWSKIEPKPGIFDEKALAHYHQLCTALQKNGIKPVVVLHHYTIPQWFAAMDGFEKKENIVHFSRYCKTVFERLAEFNPLWITFHSPTAYVARGYHAHLAPPGKKSVQLMQEVLRNLLDAHVQIYQTLKALPCGKNAVIGICHNIYQVEPKYLWDHAGVSTAAKLMNKNVYEFFTTGKFHVSVPFMASVDHFNPLAPKSLDFIGLGYYSHGYMSNFNVDPYPGELPTQNKIYTIYPEGLYCALQELTKALAKPLNIPIYVVENGIATDNESHRETYFKRYLYALSYACATGCPVKGYLVWSLMDNYEWGHYDKKYGVFAVDFKTQERSKMPREGASYLIDTIKKFRYC